MYRQAQAKRQPLRPALFLALFLLAALASAGRASAKNWAGAAYIVTGHGGASLVLTEGDPAPALDSELLRARPYGGGFELYLAAGQYVTIHHDGDVSQALIKEEESVTELLSRLDVFPSPLEAVRVDLSGAQPDLTVSSDILYEEQVRESVPHETVRVANDQLLKGTERVVQEGADGIRGAVYEVLWSNGGTVSRQLTRVLDSTVQDRVVEYGTAVPKASGTEEDSAVNAAPKEVTGNPDGSGVLILDNGQELRYTAVRTMSATAYTAGYGGVGTRTASGTAVHRGTVAVDRSVIPLGTRMYIITKNGYVYGLATAEDTGVKGNKVDLYLDTYQQCINFGRQDCLVYILE